MNLGVTTTRPNWESHQRGPHTLQKPTRRCPFAPPALGDKSQLVSGVSTAENLKQEWVDITCKPLIVSTWSHVESRFLARYARSLRDMRSNPTAGFLIPQQDQVCCSGSRRG